MRTRMITLGLGATLALAACGTDGGGGAEASADDYPEEALEWTIAFGPGGGNDIMSRTIVDILEKEEFYTEDIAVENVEGGSGAKGWGEVMASAGDPYAISTTSGSFLTTPLEADTGWTWEDFTHVGLFATDDALFLVPPDSNITTWDELVEYAQGQDQVAVGGIGTVNVDFIHHAMLAEQAGYEIDYVPFNEEGQLITALLSGSVEAIISNPGEVLGQVEANEMVPLLFTGAEPMDALPDVPTGEELGFEDLVSMPRGLILPPEVSDDARQWWIDTMQEVIETPEWDSYLKDNNLNEDVRWGDDFSAYLEETVGEFEEVLTEHGAL